MIFLGKHLVKSSASTQAVIALSSGESEFYGAVKTASTGLGMIHLLADMGVDIREPLDLSSTRAQVSALHKEEVQAASGISQPQRCGCRRR